MNPCSAAQRRSRVIAQGKLLALALVLSVLPAPPTTPVASGQQFLADELRRQAERVIGDVIRSVPLPQQPGGQQGSGQSSVYRRRGPDRIEYDRIEDYTPQIDSATFHNSTGEMLSSAFGNVLVIHPFTGGRPAVVERTAYLAGDRPSLEFSVRGHPLGDMLVRVWATPAGGRAEQIYQQTVVGSHGWQPVSLDLSRYRGQTVSVRLEVHATGWHFEYAALDAFYVEGGTQTVAAASSRVAAARPAGLDPAWFGRWKSQDGERELLISRSKIEFSALRTEDDGRRQRVNYEHRWIDSTEPTPDGSEFGYANRSTSPAAISKRYEAALAAYRRDPSDYAVSEPGPSRAAIAALAPGTYRVMWSFGGGDCGEDYILDRNRLLEVTDCKYQFTVQLFNRSSR